VTGAGSGAGSTPTSLGASFGVPEGVRRVAARSEGTARIVLVRHGEAVCNVSGIVGGKTGCTGLTDLGRRQVMALADRLVRTGELGVVDALYSSVLPRAVETAELLRPALGLEGAPVIEIVQQCDLCELHPGEADGMSWQQVIDAFGVPDWDTDPGLVIAPVVRAGADSCSGSRWRCGVWRIVMRARWSWPQCMRA
jgi:Histidine phosphatase superfamily (branch 1)